jgi:hypothetical protein
MGKGNIRSTETEFVILRDRVAAAAERGTKPSSGPYSEATLQRAFAGCEDDLALLELKAVEVQENRRERERRAAAERKVNKLAAAYYDSWISAEEPARREEARQAARLELGLD